jgi:hypothetical protein
MIFAKVCGTGANRMAFEKPTKNILKSSHSKPYGIQEPLARPANGYFFIAPPFNPWDTKFPASGYTPTQIWNFLKFLTSLIHNNPTQIQ